MAAEKNPKVREMDRQRCGDGNEVKGNIKEGVYSLWYSYAVVVHHLASEDTGMGMSDEQVGDVAFCPEFLAVCTLDRGIRNGVSTAKRQNLRFINAVCCR